VGMRRIPVSGYEYIQQLLEEHFGLSIDTQESYKLEKNIQGRMNILDIIELKDYLNILSENSQISLNELCSLATNLTNNESYFFRDPPQMALLRTNILPELIKRRGSVKRLNILSAGCANGEEIYSLSILLNELLNPEHTWQLDIVGIDINNEVLKFARQATYNDWSFRGVSSEIKKHYFSTHNSKQKLNSQIVEMVRFEQQNILAPDFPDQSDYQDYFDLILCRNVFIYFTHQAVKIGLTKLCQALKPDGLLLTGHGELMNQEMLGLNHLVYPESAIYQKVTPEIIQTTAPPATKLLRMSKQFKLSSLPAPATFRAGHAMKYKLAQPATEQMTQLLEQIQINIVEKEYTIAESELSFFLKQTPDNFAGLMLMAQLKADQGEHSEAIRYCQLSMQQQRFASTPHFLMAQIRQEQGDIDAALNELKKTIYLEPDHLASYLLASTLQTERKKYRIARQMYMTARDLLKHKPPGERIEYINDITAGELLTQLDQALEL